MEVPEFQTYFGRQSRGRISADFKRDLADLLKLSREARVALAQAAVRSFTAQTDREKQAIRDDLVRRFESEAVSLGGPFNLLKFFGEAFLSDPADDPIANDDPQSIASDLAKMEDVLPKSVDGAADSLSQVLKAVKQGAVGLRDTVRRMRFETGVLPSFKGIGTTVEVRAVMATEYEWGKSVEEYTPALAEIVGVASIRIKLARSQPEAFCFQATNDELKILIDSLRATQKELQLLEQSIKINVKP